MSKRERLRFLKSFSCMGVLISALMSPIAVQNASAQTDGKTFVVVLPGDPEMINSSLTTEISSINLSGQVYSTLVRLDNDGVVHPELAKSWEVAPDGLTYTFHLHEGIKTHDGTPFTSEDVAWGLMNLNYKYNGGASGLFDPVDRIETPDENTVVFKMKYVYPPFLRGLAYFSNANLVPKYLFDKEGDPRQNPVNFNPVGTGPFIFKEYRRGSHIIFERNPDHYIEGEPMVDRLVFQIIPNQAARALALEKGEVDFIPYYAMALGEVERLRASPDVTVTVAKRQIAGIYMAFLNTRGEHLGKKEVRQALYYGLDRSELLEKAGFGFGQVSAGPISSEQPTFYTDKVRIYDYDPERAEKMLDEAGYPRGADGKRFALRVSYDQKEGPMDAAARLMRVQFSKIGVDLQVMPMDTGAWRDSAFKAWDFDITMGSFATGPDPATGVSRLYQCKTIEKLVARNASGYCNPELDEIFEAAAQEIDEDKRVELYHKVQATLAEDVPHLWLWDRFYPIAYRKGWTGLPTEPTAYAPYDRVKLAQ